MTDAVRPVPVMITAPPVPSTVTSEGTGGIQVGVVNDGPKSPASADSAVSNLTYLAGFRVSRDPLPPDVRAALVDGWADILFNDYLRRHSGNRAANDELDTAGEAEATQAVADVVFHRKRV
jgi:hypothetical protein